MIDFAAASPPGINAGSGVWLQRGRSTSFPIWPSSASRRQFPSISTRCSNEKDQIQGFKVDAISHKTVPSNLRPKKERNPGRLSSSASSSKMTPGYFSIIRYPLGTESAMKAMLEFNTLVFIVDKGADKNAIKDAVMELFKVGTKKVNTLMRPDGSKKAFVTLAPNFSAVDVGKMFKFL